MSTTVNIAEKLMAVRLKCSFSFGRTTDKNITAQVNHANQTHALQVKKDLFPADAGTTLRALHAMLNTFYAYHKRITLSSLNEGERLLPVRFYLDYMREFGAYQGLVKDAYDSFVQSYLASQTRAQVLLGPAYCKADYPDITELERYLKFSVQTLPLPQAGTLLAAVGESIQSDVDSFLDEAMGAAFADVNARVKVSLERMVKQLSDPKGRVFDSLTESMGELVSLIPEFNVTNDETLNRLAFDITASLLVSSDLLRTSPDKRKQVADAAADILARMT